MWYLVVFLLLIYVVVYSILAFSEKRHTMTNKQKSILGFVGGLSLLMAIVLTYLNLEYWLQ